MPPELERREVRPTPPGSARCCPHGGRYVPFGEDVSSELEVIPAQFFVTEIHRRKDRLEGRGHPDCPRVKTAPLPVRPIDPGRPRPGLLAAVAVDRYADYLPLSRREAMYAR